LATQRELAEVLGNSADTARALGQTTEATEHYRDALTLLRRLVSEHPETLAVRDEHARILKRMTATQSSNSP
jgi:hypothetical protein